MGSYANISHNIKQIASAYRWGIMQKHPVDAATSAFDLLGGYPGGRIRADGEAGGGGGTSEAAGSCRMGSKRLKQDTPK